MTANRIFTRSLLFLLLAQWGMSLHAQEAFAELNRLRARYSSPDSYSARLLFRAYKGHGSDEMADQQAGFCEISGKRMRLAMGTSLTLRNETYALIVDEHFREIEVSDAKKYAAEMPYGDFSRIDSILRKNRALSVRTLPDGNRLLTVDLSRSGNEYEKITVKYKPAGELIMLAFYYRGKARLYGIEDDYRARVEIEYRDQHFDAVFPAGHFSEKKYVRIDNRQVSPQPAYKNYQIFDLL